MWNNSYYFRNPKVSPYRKEQPISYWTKKRIIEYLEQKGHGNSRKKLELANKITLEVLRHEFLHCVNFVEPDNRDPNMKYTWLYIPLTTKFFGTEIEELERLSSLRIEKNDENETFLANVEFIRWDNPGYMRDTTHYNDGEIESYKNVIVEKRGTFYHFKRQDGSLIAKKKVDSWGTKIERIDN